MFELSAFSDLVVWLFFLGNEAKSAEVDNGILQAIRNSDRICMAKNIYDGRVETTITAEKNSNKTNMTNIWKNYGYFNQQLCNFSMEKANLLENSVFYINQAY